MKYGVYSYRDVVANAFTPPQCDVNDETAKRGFAYAVNNNGLMAFRPKDYDLYKIGEFDPETGVIDRFDVPIMLVSAVSVLEDKE